MSWSRPQLSARQASRVLEIDDEMMSGFTAPAIITGHHADDRHHPIHAPGALAEQAGGEY
jgi:hypothetical protein